MHIYRLELLGSDDQVESSREVTCVDDEEALLRALNLAHAHAVIVWQAHRRVGDVRDSTIYPRTQVG